MPEDWYLESSHERGSKLERQHMCCWFPKLMHWSRMCMPRRPNQNLHLVAHRLAFARRLVRCLPLRWESGRCFDLPELVSPFYKMMLLIGWIVPCHVTQRWLRAVNKRQWVYDQYWWSSQKEFAQTTSKSSSMTAIIWVFILQKLEKRHGTEDGHLPDGSIIISKSHPPLQRRDERRCARNNYCGLMGSGMKMLWNPLGTVLWAWAKDAGDPVHLVVFLQLDGKYHSRLASEIIFSTTLYWLKGVVAIIWSISLMSMTMISRQSWSMNNVCCQRSVGLRTCSLHHQVVAIAMSMRDLERWLLIQMSRWQWIEMRHCLSSTWVRTLITILHCLALTSSPFW